MNKGVIKMEYHMINENKFEEIRTQQLDKGLSTYGTHLAQSKLDFDQVGRHFEEEIVDGINYVEELLRQATSPTNDVDIDWILVERLENTKSQLVHTWNVYQKACDRHRGGW